MLVDVRVAASKVAEWRREQRGKRAAITAVITSAAREAEEGRRQKSTRRATITAVITGAAKEAEEGRRQKSTKRATITAAIREDAARRRMVSMLYRISPSSILCAYCRNPLVFLFRARSKYICVPP